MFIATSENDYLSYDVHRGYELVQKENLYHEYEYTTEICSRSSSQCTAQNVFNSVKDNSVPFQDGRLENGIISKIPGIGKVITTVDDVNHKLVNTTLPGHAFEHGTVERSLGITQDAISVHTFGSGVNTSSFTRSANIMAGYYFPQVLDRYIQSDFRQ